MQNHKISVISQTLHKSCNITQSRCCLTLSLDITNECNITSSKTISRKGVPTRPAATPSRGNWSGPRIAKIENVVKNVIRWLLLEAVWIVSFEEFDRFFQCTLWRKCEKCYTLCHFWWCRNARFLYIFQKISRPMSFGPNCIEILMVFHSFQNAPDARFFLKKN